MSDASEFVVWTENFDYEKEFYEMLLPDGTRLYGWPNAGKIEGFDHTDGIKVRKASAEEALAWYREQDVPNISTMTMGRTMAHNMFFTAPKNRHANRSCYAPHQGSKEMQRRLKRMQRAKDTGEK